MDDDPEDDAESVFASVRSAPTPPTPRLAFTPKPKAKPS
jgi:hypothetical protein